MGWQGRLRDVKGRRLWNSLPERLRKGRTFISAHIWRDGNTAWLKFREPDGKIANGLNGNGDGSYMQMITVQRRHPKEEARGSLGDSVQIEKGNVE